jgi:Zn-dependent membrane protease YugP
MISLGSTLGYLMLIGGVALQIPLVAWIGVILISGGAVFALVTLPVELDASNRAMRMLNENGFIRDEEERKAARQMLNSAALTYVAGAAQAVSTILYYVFALMSSRSSRQRG